MGRRILEREPELAVLGAAVKEAARGAGSVVLVYGEASRSDGVRRLPLRRLSEDAVRQLSAGSPVDPGRLFSLTSGNPFFVAEVLASAHGDGVPPTILDAVLGRVRRLDAATQDVLEQLAVVPSTPDRRLVDALAPDSLASLAAAEERGCSRSCRPGSRSGTSSPAGPSRTRCRRRGGWS